MKIEIRYPYGRGIKMTFAMFLQSTGVVSKTACKKSSALQNFRHKNVLYNHINTNFTSKKVYRAEHAEYTDTRSIFLSS